MENFPIYETSIWIGIIGFILIIFTSLLGYRIIKTPVKMHLHRRIGILGLVACTIHSFIMFYFYLFT